MRSNSKSVTKKIKIVSMFQIPEIKLSSICHSLSLHDCAHITTHMCTHHTYVCDVCTGSYYTCYLENMFYSTQYYIIYFHDNVCKCMLVF